MRNEQHRGAERSFDTRYDPVFLLCFLAAAAITVLGLIPLLPGGVFAGEPAHSIGCGVWWYFGAAYFILALTSTDGNIAGLVLGTLLGPLGPLTIFFYGVVSKLRSRLAHAQ